MITAIGGRETAAGTTIEIVRVTPISTGDSAVVATIPEQGEGVREQIATATNGPAPDTVQPIGHRDGGEHAIWEAEWITDPTNGRW